MSGKKSRTRGKSGLLTGIMIVSTGLIAGFHGFELATAEQNEEKSFSKNSSAISSQVGALDLLITASLKEGDVVSNGASNDQKGLDNLIQAASNTPGIVNEAPVVNRGLKRDRETMPVVKPVVRADDRQSPDDLTSFIQAEQNSRSLERGSYSELAARQAKRQKIAAGANRPDLVKTTQPVVEQVVQNKEIPYADSADIALFAADMPLPAKMVQISHNAQVPLAGNGRAPSNYSALVPRKFVSGKAFGGLAEREFQKRERRCMTTALYFEARSEPKTGQIAVGQVVMNRVRSPDYPDTICGVVYQGSHRRTGCQFSFTCDGKADKPNSTSQWERSKILANKVLEGKAWLNSIGHATHYHATYVKPRWRRKMSRLKQIGRHIFYKSPNISVTETYQRFTNGKRG